MGRPAKFDTDEAVEQAMNVFWEHGYAGTTPQMLVTELGIGKGSLYHSFESKQNLFTLALQRYNAHRSAAIADVLARSGSVRPKLRKIMLILTGVGGHRRGCLVVNAVGELTDPEEQVAQAATDLFDMITTEFTRAIKRGRAAGEFSGNDDPGGAARSLLATVIGISVLAKTSTSHDRLRHTINESIAAVCPPLPIA
jgi:TetR/AcrR family transcriptional regulator, transcriptional repressor for nem operon